jgi:hypothetical protein
MATSRSISSGNRKSNLLVIETRMKIKTDSITKLNGDANDQIWEIQIKYLQIRIDAET